MKKKQTQRIIRIALAVGTIISLFFVPWLLVKAWILPLPGTVQEQLDEAIGHGFDGMIVYVDQAGKAPQYLAAGWHDREVKIPANPNALFKIASISKLPTRIPTARVMAVASLSILPGQGSPRSSGQACPATGHGFQCPRAGH